jgi:predicted ABC-class ATPase
MAELRSDLEKIDGRPYGFYKDLRGRSYTLGAYDLIFEHIQGDPFAAPSRIRVDIPAARVAFPDWAYYTADARRAAADFLHRAVLNGLARARQRMGSGKSGLLEMLSVGQQVLERTAVHLGQDGAARLRLSVGLPAAGRRILGREAATLLTERLPEVLNGVLDRLDLAHFEQHIQCVEDQIALRNQLTEKGLVAFLAEGSVLPRQSGADDQPMDKAIPLEVPHALACELAAPHAGILRGLGIRAGVTLIAGGGYHGKSTLLAALANGVYDHIPADGRDRCVTVASTVSIRAEDGRSVCGVDLRPFINALPLGRRTDWFDTDDASGSTSQAAAIVEALEVGAAALLIDEDTAATNFMIRDARMRRLVPSDKEPITPYLDRVRQLWDERGVSSILVVGGAGDYLDVADTVIHMDEYRPHDVTARAKEIAVALPQSDSGPRTPGDWLPAAARLPDPRSLDASRGKKAERVRSVKTRTIEFGTEEIEVSLLSQLVDPAQCRMIADVLLECSRGLCDGRRSLAEILDLVDTRIDEEGLEAVTQSSFGDRARARRFEIAAALNRLRSLRLVGQRKE